MVRFVSLAISNYYPDIAPPPLQSRAAWVPYKFYRLQIGSFAAVEPRWVSEEFSQ